MEGINCPHFVKTHLKLSTTKNEDADYQLFWICEDIISLKSCPVNDVLLDKSVMNIVDHAYPVNFHSNRRDITIAGCCNGLLCIDVEDKKTVFICNPSSRMWNQLPSSGFEKRYVEFSFGYDDLTDDYKVVGIPWFGNARAAKIFSLKSGKWKNIDCILPDGIQLCFDKGVFLNGAIHWEAKNSKSSSDHFAILSLDLAQETYGQVAPPVYDHDDDQILGVLGDSLCVLYDYYESHADVWVMKVYGVKDSWTKLVSIPYATAQPTSDDHISMPLFISNDGKLLFQLGNKLVVYDSKNKSFSEIQNFGACDYVCTFIESLVSPYTATGLADNTADEK